MPTHCLDEIAIADPEVVTASADVVADQITARVGSIVEYEFLRRHTRQDLPRLTAHSAEPIVERIERICAGECTMGSLSLKATDVDALAIPPTLRDDVTWSAFVKRADATARSVGFADTVAAGLAGAIGELADNIMQHSEAPNTGVAAFAARPGRFEYVVADAGIGMLDSLRRASEFRSIRDDIEALQLAVTSGVSKHGRGVGYGYGYRAVFLPLRAASGMVRLRSGLAVLEVSGVGPTPDQARCIQRPQHRGVVVSVELSTMEGGPLDAGAQRGIIHLFT